MKRYLETHAVFKICVKIKINLQFIPCILRAAIKPNKSGIKIEDVLENEGDFCSKYSGLCNLVKTFPF